MSSDNTNCAVRDLFATFSVAAVLFTALLALSNIGIGFSLASATFLAVGANMAMRRAWPAVFNPRPAN